MRAFAAVAAAALMLALAGCSGSSEETPRQHTCPNGTVVDVPANMTETPEAACPPPVPPSITLGAAPADLAIYREAEFSWAVAAGEYAQGHSMLTSLRVSSVSSPDAGKLSGPESYGSEVAKKEHQNLPASAVAQHTFTTPGTYYLRAYATIQANGLPAKDYWTPEVAVVVADITPTGNDTTVVHGAGNVAGGLTPATVNLSLGDGVVLQNDDLVEHVFTPGTCPQEFAPVAVPDGESSAPLVFKAPGTCTFTTDDVQKLTLTVNIAT